MYVSGLVMAALAAPPNVVMILTDDQDTLLGNKATSYTELGSMASQPVLQKLMMEEGVRMSNYFVQTPICCPSRTEFFTGRYFHNIRGEDGVGCMRANTTYVHEAGGIFNLFTSAGYETGVFGKTTNDQQPQLEALAKTKSVTHIDAPLDYNDYNGLTWYRYFSNGTRYVETVNKTDPVFGSIYQTSQIANRTIEWLDSLQKVPKEDRKPFFLYLGPHAPHFPATPAPWYEDLYPDFAAPVTPNYNVSSPDKTRHIRQNPPLTDLVKCWEDQHFRDRWRTLASVDDLLTVLFNKVEDMGEMDNTFFVYTSDHGYKFGQWRVGVSKEHPYETDIRIPLIVRGPGIPKGVVMKDLLGSSDIMPTLLDFAGIPKPEKVDGRSFAGLLFGSSYKPRGKWLIEYEATETIFFDHAPVWSPPNVSVCPGPLPRGPNITEPNCHEVDIVGGGNCYFIDSTASNTWRALRILNTTHNLQYIEYDHTWTWNSTSIEFHELYDLNNDEYQMNNIYNASTSQLKEALHSELVDYYNCVGNNCP
eukprot:TRINITY_DN763_c0_g2_i1.p1 TRINITY_DN763_c0_g2~~TRINITY_DN763_c0_g2_i1.p1  ORF type:complete len:532 (+),score=69.66 TRINITY_DN763_c0_g2_i1:45-1640(+)